MPDIIQDAKRLVEQGFTPPPWGVVRHDFGYDSHFIAGPVELPIKPGEPNIVRECHAALIAAAPELAQALAEESYEYIAEWCDHGVWAPIEMEMFDGTFPNLQAARGYIKVAKTRGAYEDTRIVRRRVSPPEVINE